LAQATSQIGMTNYTVALVGGHHRLSADEAVDVWEGMRVRGAYELLCAALGACESMSTRS